MASGAKGTISKTAVWVILVLLIVGLAGFGATNFGGSVRTVGTVGDTDIGVDRYVRELNQELRAISAQTGQQISMTQAQQLGLDRAVLQRLVSTVALENEAAKLGLSVGDAEIRDQILGIPAFQGLDGTFDREAYSYTLEQSGLTETEFEDNLRAEVARTMLQAALSAGVAPPEVYVDTLLGFVAERRSFTWAAIGPDALDEPVGEPSESDLKSYFDENPDRYRLPETRVISYAWLTPDMLIDSIEVDETALRELYEARESEFNRPERRIVERLVFGTEDEAAAAMRRIEAGEASFEEIVAARGLALSDIDLGDVTESELGAAGAEVFALDEPGVVGPLDSDLGPALFRMNAILNAQETSFEDARAELIDEYALDRARRSIGDRIEEIDDLLAGGATLEELGRETAMQTGTIEWSSGETEGIAAYDAFRTAAQQAEIGDFPEVLELDDGGIFALRLDQVLEPRLPPFDAVRDEVARDWRAARTVERLAEEGAARAERIAGGAAMDEVGLAPQTETDVARDGFVPGTPPDFLSRVFDMQEGTTEVIEGANAAYVVRLDEVLTPDLDDPELAARRDSLSASAAQSIGQDILRAYVSAVETQAGIQLNQAAINAVHAQFQ